jgi:hypothetical protein
MLERKPFTDEDRARIAAQAPRLLLANSRIHPAKEWVVDSRGDTFLIHITDRRDPREPEQFHVFGYDTRVLPLGFGQRSGVAYVSWYRWEGLADDAVERINALVKEAYYLLYPGKHPRDVLVQARHPEPPMTDEESRRNEVRFNEIAANLAGVMTSVSEGARARLAVKRGARTLMLGSLAIVAVVIALAATLMSGCTSQQLNDNAQGWREAECDKIFDTPRRERCLKEAKQ